MTSDEIGQAANIKSKATRLAVTSALVSIRQRLKVLKRMPENGLAIFCGANIAEDTENPSPEITLVEPLAPLQHPLYRCAKYFHTQVLTVGYQ